MPNKDEIVNVSAPSDVTSIQIMINLGKPTQTVGAENVLGGVSQAPMGVFIRQVVQEPGNNPTKKIRTSFVPDDLAQDASTHIADPDVGEVAKMKELLNDKVNENDIDAGIIAVRLNEEGGTITWLPDNASLAPVVERFTANTPEGGGLSIGDFIQCWLTKGQTAAAGANCWSRL